MHSLPLVDDDAHQVITMVVHLSMLRARERVVHVVTDLAFLLLMTRGLAAQQGFSARVHLAVQHRVLDTNIALYLSLGTVLFVLLNVRLLRFVVNLVVLDVQQLRVRNPKRKFALLHCLVVYLEALQLDYENLWP